MQVDYSLLKWNEGCVFEHKRLTADYEKTCKMFRFHVRHSKNVPLEVESIHTAATHRLSEFLDRMNVKKLIVREKMPAESLQL